MTTIEAPVLVNFVCPSCRKTIGAVPTATVWCSEHGEHVRCAPAPEHADTVATARRRAREARKKARYRRRHADTSNGGHDALRGVANARGRNE